MICQSWAIPHQSTISAPEAQHFSSHCRATEWSRFLRRHFPRCLLHLGMRVLGPVGLSSLCATFGSFPPGFMNLYFSQAPSSHNSPCRSILPESMAKSSLTRTLLPKGVCRTMPSSTALNSGGSGRSRQFTRRLATLVTYCCQR